MRLDKYLKVSRIIKRRSLAKEVADAGRITVNDRVAKSSTTLNENDIIHIKYGKKIITIRVLKLTETTRKDEANAMYEIIEEKYISED